MYEGLIDELRSSRPNRRLAFQAADAIEELSRDLDSMNEANIALYGALPRWISVEERLPELRQNVLVSDGKGSGEGWLDRYDWHDPNREDVVYTSPQPRDFWCIPGCEVDEEHVTHWMALPEPPKEENHADN